MQTVTIPCTITFVYDEEDENGGVPYTPAQLLKMAEDTYNDTPDSSISDYLNISDKGEWKVGA